MSSSKLEQRFSAIEMILSDVDGVLTDGSIVYDNQGIETKRFHVRDGLGIKLWQRAGYEFGILTARTSQIVRLRATELGLKIVRQGFEDKLPVCIDVINQSGLSAEQVCYIGDDLSDIPVMKHMGLGVAVADSTAEVVDHADFVTTAAGGKGAVRELIETLLKARRRWDDLIRKYTL